MNKTTYWMVTLLIIFVAVLSPAKGKTVDGVVNPSTTLTIKSLIEAQCDEIKVVCPPAVHKNIKCLTPCAMGYRAVIGRNRVIITHMWPARSVDEFHRRTRLKSLDNPKTALPNLEATPQVVKGLEKVEAEARAEKARADALQADVLILKAEKEKLETLINKLEADKMFLEKEILTLKQDGVLLAEKLKQATEAVVVIQKQKEKEIEELKKEFAQSQKKEPNSNSTLLLSIVIIIMIIIIAVFASLLIFSKRSTS